MNQAVMLINCYLYGATAVMLLVLVLIVYLRGQMNHFPNPFAKKNLVYRHPAQAKGILFGKKFGLLAYSPEQDEGHILVLGPSGTGKTSALLIPTLRSWQGTALVVDISGDISANVHTENKIIFICYYGMGWGFVEICEFFLGHDWRSLLNDIAKQQNPIANMFISSFAGASEQNTAGCKQAADDALKLFATNEKIKNALRKSASYEQSISPATLETNSIYVYIPEEKLEIYGDLMRIITAQSMEYFSSRPKENKQMILFCLDEFASFGKLQITPALRRLRKRRIRILVLTQSVSDVDMIYGKDERIAMLGNFKFTVILGCKDTETQEYFSKMIGEKRSLLATDPNQKRQPIIKPADLAHLEQDLFVICDDGAIRLRKNFYFK